MDSQSAICLFSATIRGCASVSVVLRSLNCFQRSASVPSASRSDPDASGAAPPGELGLPWREFFLAAPNPQVIVDEDGHIIRANRVFEDLFEYASAELQRTTYWDAFLTGQQADNAAEEFLRHSGRSLLPDIEQVWITRTGNPICIRWHRTAVEDPSTRVRHFLLSAGANDLGRNAVRQLAARYAQGFRNHLTVVTGYSELYNAGIANSRC